MVVIIVVEPSFSGGKRADIEGEKAKLPFFTGQALKIEIHREEYFKYCKGYVPNCKTLLEE